MNDRFKFRVWNIEDCTYFEPRDFDDLWLNKNAELRIGFYSDATQMIEDCTDNVIIEQCTGLKDKNGNLIYEGDVVLFNDDDYPWQIKWNKVFARWVLYSPLGSNEDGEEELTDTDAEYLEIIGNIHEQAEQKDK